MYKLYDNDGICSYNFQYREGMGAGGLNSRGGMAGRRYKEQKGGGGGGG